MPWPPLSCTTSRSSRCWRPLPPRSTGQPDNARFTWDGSRATLLRKSADGQALNQAAALATIRTTVQAGGRRVDLPVEVAHPGRVGDAAGPQLGIREVLAREHHVVRGLHPRKGAQHQARRLTPNGVVVPPVGTFSFNKAKGWAPRRAVAAGRVMARGGRARDRLPRGAADVTWRQAGAGDRSRRDALGARPWRQRHPARAARVGGLRVAGGLGVPAGDLNRLLDTAGAFRRKGL